MGTGTWDCFLSFFLGPQGLRERVESKTWRCFGKGREGGQPFASFLFSFFFFSFFVFFFPFFVSSLFYEPKRNETKRNETKLCGSNSSFMTDLEMSPKKEFQIIFI